MNIDKTSFYPTLLPLLTSIGEAHFIAFDLELSGVPSKDPYSTTSKPGKPTLQDRYVETKAAAERYQILQIGLTCVRQDASSGEYILKPYNFDLSPVIAERGLDIERIFSFQSGAAEFLLKVGFDIGRPFASGVPYLSRAEAQVARERHARRQDRSALADIEVKSTDTESLAFLARVRTEIKEWKTDRPSVEYLNVTPALNSTSIPSHPPPDELSRFEKRLVHQLIRAEFPDLVSISRRNGVQIVRFNQDRENRILAERNKELDERLARQKGFRWIFQALFGSEHLSGIDIRECGKDPLTGEHISHNPSVLRAEYERAKYLLSGRPKVLVGHNCFLDLVYLWRTFMGPLPGTVQEFSALLADKWPLIVDTKYLSTHECGDINPVSSLEQIAQQLSASKSPVVLRSPETHIRYEQVESPHEAGFDSYLTAQIMVRLSARLFREGEYPVDVPAEVSIPAAPEKLKEEEGFTPSIPSASWEQNGGDPTLVPPSSANSDHRHRPLPPSPETIARLFANAKEGKGMPPFESKFWKVYGNRLRVFGTGEGVMIVEKGKRGEGGIDGGKEEKGEGDEDLVTKMKDVEIAEGQGSRTKGGREKEMPVPGNSNAAPELEAEAQAEAEELRDEDGTVGGGGVRV